MTVTLDIDTSQVDKFVADLKGASARLLPAVVPVVKRAAQNIKTDTQNDMRASSDPGFRGIAGRVNYDEPVATATGVSTVVGIDKGGAGNLGNIAIFGTSKGGGTHMHPAFWAAQEMPRFEAEVLKAVGGLV